MFQLSLHPLQMKKLVYHPSHRPISPLKTNSCIVAFILEYENKYECEFSVLKNEIFRNARAHNCEFALAVVAVLQSEGRHFTFIPMLRHCGFTQKISNLVLISNLLYGSKIYSTHELS